MTEQPLHPRKRHPPPAQATEHEKDRQLELLKLEGDARAKAEELFIKSREAEQKFIESTRKSVQDAERLRIEAEKARAEIVGKLGAVIKNTYTDNLTPQTEL